jgi:SAM-dependent methyltransferase
MLKTVAKNVLRPVWTPLRRRIEFVVRNEIARKGSEPAIRSMVCRQKDFAAPWYQRWTQEIANGAPVLPADQEAVWGTVWKGMRGKWMHRKLWEWCVIAQALEERDMLRPGRRGIGFAVGKEPLSSLFAARGAHVLASDFQGEDALETWASTGQLGNSVQTIHWPGVVPEAEFATRVQYQNIDMRDLSAVPKDAFDFSWSSCSFEHLGGLDEGLQFLVDSLECLKPGGVAVHTTEYNVSSNEDTIEDDMAPFYTHGRQHVKLKLHGYIATSLVLIIRKPF